MLNRKTLTISFGVFAVFALFLSSCLKSLDEIELSGSGASYAFPLFSTSLTVNDLLSKTLNDTLPGDTLIINSNGEMTLIYSGDVTEVRASTLYSFLDQPFGGPIPLTDTIFYAPFAAPPDVDIYRGDLKQGTILVAGQNNFTEPITGKVTIPQLTLNGVPYEFGFAATPNGFFASAQTDLTGYILTSNNDSLLFKYEAYLPNGQRVKLNTVGIIIQNVRFSYVEGYWGNAAYPIDRDTIEIDINQTNFTAGDIIIKNPRVTLTIFNSFGFPSRGDIKTLQFKGRDGVFYQLQSDTIQNGGIDFSYPSLQLGEVGQVKTTIFNFDETNSNIGTIFNSQPVAMDYEVVGIANVLQDPNLVGFLTDSSFMRFNIKVELPLEGTVKNFGADNTIALDFGNQSNTNTADIDSVVFKLVTENGMPIGVDGQVYFLDEQENKLDSLFTLLTPILDPAPVDANGVANQIAKKEQYIKLSGEQFDRIRNAKKAQIRTVIESTGKGQTCVKILSGMKTDIRMGVLFYLKR